MREKLVVFASGTKDGGGSGFKNLAESPHFKEGRIAGVVSNHKDGGVRKHAEELGIPFEHFNGPFDAEQYRKIIEKFGAKKVALLGWMKHVLGLDSAETINTHPALLSHGNGRFGGPGMYDIHVHRAVKQALDNGEITETGISIHFVTDKYDQGPVFFEYRIPLTKGMTAEEIRDRVRAAEHFWQPKILNMVLKGEIRWDGKDPKSLVVPAGYPHLPRK